MVLIMLETITIVYKLGQEAKPSRRGNQSKNGQAAYKEPMSFKLEDKQTKSMNIQVK